MYHDYNMEKIMEHLQAKNIKKKYILDTDAYNEIDDQFAISYMLKQPEKFNVKGICAAPFFNQKSTSAEDGMIKSYNEILKLLSLMGKDKLRGIVYEGSREYLKDEKTPVISPSAELMAKLANEYSSEKPLYIVAIGAITNVASAILLNPKMVENCVLVWLGGSAIHLPSPASEFNMMQDIAGARVVFGRGIPLVQLPCGGIVDHFTTSKYELEHWLMGKNALCDYLCDNTVNEAESYAKGRPWTRVIWDVTAVAWLVNDNNRFMKDCLVPSPIPQYDLSYAQDPTRHFIKYVYEIHRDALFEDLFNVLSK